MGIPKPLKDFQVSKQRIVFTGGKYRILPVLVAPVFRILIQIEGRLDRSETFGPNVLSVVDVGGVNEPDLSAHYSDEKVERTLRRTLNRRSGGRLL